MSVSRGFWLVGAGLFPSAEGQAQGNNENDNQLDHTIIIGLGGADNLAYAACSLLVVFTEMLDLPLGEVCPRCPNVRRALGLLGTLINVARTVVPGEKESFPARQGMQYLRNMYEGRAKLEPLDNDRYPNTHWTTARDVLSAHLVTRQS